MQTQIKCLEERNSKMHEEGYMNASRDTLVQFNKQRDLYEHILQLTRDDAKEHINKI